MCFICIIFLDSYEEAALLFPFDSLENDEKLAPEHSGTRWGDRI